MSDLDWVTAAFGDLREQDDYLCDSIGHLTVDGTCLRCDADLGPITTADRAQFERDDEAEAKVIARAAEHDYLDDCD